MTIEDQIAAAVSAQVRAAVREELRSALGQLEPKAAPTYLSIARAAEIAEVAPDTIRLWLKERRLPTCRAGRELRVKLSDLVAFVEGKPVAEVKRPAPEEQAEALLRRQR